MAKTAVMVRLSEGELTALDAMALKNGISRATCATSILRRSLKSVDHATVSQPGVTATAFADGTAVTTTQKGTTWSRPEPDDCVHPFRDQTNTCRVCGDKR